MAKKEGLGKKIKNKEEGPKIKLSKDAVTALMVLGYDMEKINKLTREEAEKILTKNQSDLTAQLAEKEKNTEKSKDEAEEEAIMEDRDRFMERDHAEALEDDEDWVKAQAEAVEGFGLKEKIPEQEKREIEKETAQLSPEEQESAKLGLLNVGFKVEKWKNDVFAKAFGFFAKTNLNQDKYTTRFTKELSDSFKRDAKNAEQRAKDMNEGKGNWKTILMSPALLAGNVFKYGRMLTDLTGKTLGLPFRYVTMAGMAVTRGAEAAKEAHLKSDEVADKTRIKDADKAADEAWKLYEQVLVKKGNEDASALEIQNEYLKQLPADLLRRLGEPSAMIGLTTNTLKWDIARAVERLNRNLRTIEDTEKLTSEQKESKKLELLNGLQWKNALRDYDRLITELGTVDKFAVAMIYTKAAGRGLVGGALAGTIEVSISKLIASLHQSGETLAAGTAGGVIAKHAPSPDAIHAKFLHAQALAKADSLGVRPDSTITTPDTTHVAGVDSTITHPDTSHAAVAPNDSLSTKPDSVKTPEVFKTDTLSKAVEAKTAVAVAGGAAVEAKTQALERGVAANFSVTLGQGDTPRNLETVFNEIASDHMPAPVDGLVNEEFATKSLNMAANMVKLVEGHNVAGVSHENFAKAVEFNMKTGVFKIINHEEFNKIVGGLQKHSEELWGKGALQGKGAAITYIQKISPGNWLKIVHADGLHEGVAPDGTLHTPTGIQGHPDITKVGDFAKSELVKKALMEGVPENSSPSSIHLDKLTTATTELNPKVFHTDPVQNIKVTTGNPTTTILENQTPSMKDGGENLYFGPRNGSMGQTIPGAQHPASMDDFGGRNYSFHGGGRGYFGQGGNDMRAAQEVFPNNLYNLPQETMQEIENLYHHNMDHLFGESKAFTAWNTLKEFRASDLMETSIVEDGTDKSALAVYIQKLSTVSELKPRGWGLFRSAEKVSDFVARATQKIAAMGKLAEIRLE